ncbi:adenylate kinase family protein [Pyrodictium abyssi]|uniref:Adenylate kinase family protein n=1 Tax=Pyrodictium abyssi TaxID=54256 RepID=A0ABM8J0S6_9CREN|nr:adenylate kinase family protein [Pyrodictium abyssi]
MIVVAGTPGTGKSLLGSNIARLLGRRFATISWIVLEKGLWVQYDARRRSFVIDYEGLLGALRRYTGYVVETHWLEPFEELLDVVEGVIVTRCNPVVLLRRLERRGWPPQKVAENVEAELMGVIAEEARRLAGKGIPVVEIDTTRGSPAQNAVDAVEMLRRGEVRCCIEWLSVLQEEELGFLLEKLTTLASGVGRNE